MDAAADLRRELDVGRETDGVQAYVVGQQALWAGMLKLQKEDLARAEIAGLPAFLIVLLAIIVLGSLLLVTWNVESRTYAVVRCQRAVAQVRDRTEGGDQLSRVGLLVGDSTLAQANALRAVVDLVATTVGRG